jgi:hypothetical protein
MKNFTKLFGIIALAAIIGFLTLTCESEKKAIEALQKAITELQQVIDEGNFDDLPKAEAALAAAIKKVNAEVLVDLLKDSGSAAQYIALQNISPETAESLKASVVTPVSDFSFQPTNNNTQIRITGYTGRNGIVVIPETIEDIPVTSIGQDAFSDTRVPIISVTIPDTVRTIGAYAFAYQERLMSINLPSSLNRINHSAFEGSTELTDLYIPESITGVEFWEYVENIMRYTGRPNPFIPATVDLSEWRRKSDNSAFKGCQKLPIRTRQRLQELGYTGAF